MPPTVVADITGRDRDGELIAAPTEWDEVESGQPPKIRIHIPRRPQPGTAAGVGDRVLLRVEKSATAKPALQRRRHQDHRSREDTPARDFPRPARRWRTSGSGRQEAGRARAEHRQGRQQRRRGRRSRQRRPGPARGFGLASGKVKERLGSLASEKAVSLIAIHAHEIPQVFSPAALREAEAAKPATLSGREDWRALPLVTIDPPDARDHDDAVHAEADSDPTNMGGTSSNRDRRRRLLCAAGLGARPRCAGTR